MQSSVPKESIDFIVCTRRPNKPRMAIPVCQNCRYRKSCINYLNYCEPPLFGQKKARKSKRK